MEPSDSEPASFDSMLTPEALDESDRERARLAEKYPQGCPDWRSKPDGELTDAMRAEDLYAARLEGETRQDIGALIGLMGEVDAARDQGDDRATADALARLHEVWARVEVSMDTEIRPRVAEELAHNLARDLEAPPESEGSGHD
jgi:hypothetical protein